MIGWEKCSFFWQTVLNLMQKLLIEIMWLPLRIILHLILLLLLITQIREFGRTNLDSRTALSRDDVLISLLKSSVAFLLTQWEKSTVILPRQPCISFSYGQELFQQFPRDFKFNKHNRIRLCVVRFNRKSENTWNFQH